MITRPHLLTIALALGALSVSPTSAQTVDWTRQLGTSGWDESRGVSADGRGNVFISGYTYGDLGGTNAGLNDAFVVKLTDETFTHFPVGDFNFDYVVDAADYTVWRDSLNQTGTDLPADADGDEIVDIDDYDLWALNFGTITSTAITVPEPTTGVLLLGMFLPLTARRTR